MAKGLTFKTVSIRNFLSYGNNTTVFDLSQPGTTLVVGRDLDTQASGTGANGVGKTALINAVTYGLYDKPISNISKENLVNNINKGNMVVTVDFEKNGTLYRIERYRKMKATKGDKSGTYVVLYKNGEDITPDSIANTNEMVERIVGIPYDMFVTIVVFAANKSTFMDLPLRQQVEMIERLFGFVELTEKAEVLKTLIKEDKQELALAEQKLEILEREHERHNTQLESAKKRASEWESDRALRLARLEQDFEKLEDLDFDHQESLINEYIDHQKEIDKVEQQIEELTAVKQQATKWEEGYKKRLSGLDEDKKILADLKEINFDNQVKLLEERDVCVDANKNHKSNIEQYNTWIRERSQQILKNNGEIEHLQDNTCPYCKQAFEDVNQKLKELQDENIQCQQLIDEFTTERDSLSVLIKQTTQKVEVIESQLLVSSRAEIAEMKGEISTLENRIAHIASEENPYVESVEQFDQLKAAIAIKREHVKALTQKQEKIKGDLLVHSIRELDAARNEFMNIKEKLEDERTKENPHTDTLVELEAVELEPIDYDTVNMIKKRMDHREFLKKLLTKRDSFVRKVLLNNHLPYLNTRLQFYLQELGLNFKVEFTHELTANITKMGRPFDFGNLSNGQQSRVNLALSFAFRDVLQKMHSRVNICILDEALDVGLDGVGVQNAARMLKQQAREQNMSLYVISHRDEMSTIFENKLTIEMEKGFSYIADQRHKGD